MFLLDYDNGFLLDEASIELTYYLLWTEEAGALSIFKLIYFYYAEGFFSPVFANLCDYRSVDVPYEDVAAGDIIFLF